MIVTRGDLIVRCWTILAVLVLAGFTLPHLIDFLQVKFWRHDSIYYVPSYGFKAVSEGRWLNYFAFPFLQYIPAWLSLSVSYGAVGYFVFYCSYRLNRDTWFALLLALAIINIPLLRMQLEWPTTLLPAFVLLGFSPWLSRRLSDVVFFAFYGVLLFGSFSSLYFLLPLLFLHDMTVKSLIRTLLLWMSCFVLGYLFSQVAVLVATGEFIAVAEWRKPSPVHSVASLIHNMQTVTGYLYSHMQVMVSILSLLLILLSLTWSAFGTTPTKRVLIWGVALVVFLAPYATTLPYGIVVSSRTAFICMLALLVGLFLHERVNHWYRSAGVLLLLGIGLSMANVTTAYTHWYKGMTDGMVNHLQASMPLLPHETDMVYLRITDSQWQRLTNFIAYHNGLSSPSLFSEGFESSHYRRSLVVSLGYDNIVLCEVEQDSVCDMPLLRGNNEALSQHAVYGMIAEGRSILLTMPDSVVINGAE